MLIGIYWVILNNLARIPGEEVAFFFALFYIINITGELTPIYGGGSMGHFYHGYLR